MTFSRLYPVTWMSILLCCLTMGCAEVDLADKNAPPKPGDMFDADMFNDQDLPQTNDMTDMTEVDMGKDMPSSTSFELCVLNARPPFDTTCAEDKTIDFGVAYAGQMTSLLVRINNTGNTPMTLDKVALNHPRLNASIVTYTNEEPPIQTTEQAPLIVDGNKSAFIQISLLADLDVVVLDGQMLTFELQTADETSSQAIAIRGQLAGCAMGSANCDGDILNGCEISTQDSLQHCGGCNVPCALDNAAEQCIEGSCSIVMCANEYDSCDTQDATGCETNITTSKDHCGACNKSCDFINAKERCEAGGCVFESCETGFQNCDNDIQTNGCEINTDSDPTNCGQCNLNCNKPHADFSCQMGTCQFDGCAQNFHDLDNNLSNGCEYACAKTSNDDVPDQANTDANCDGIDGDITRAIFVDGITGNNTGPGNQALPMKTIAAAINRAKVTNGLDHIYISKGIYTEQIYIASGVSIFGGYDAAQDWRRSSANTTTIAWNQPVFNRIVAVTAINIQNETIIDQVRIVAGNTLASSTSTYAVYCEGCNDLSITNALLIAGRAGHGQRGSDGVDGSVLFGSGSAGGRGGNGSDNGSTRGARGAAGQSACGRPGGYGGLGGAEGNNTGEKGGEGSIGINGGDGGSGGDPGKTGKVGSTGTIGSQGSNGSGGTNGQLVMGYWKGGDGEAGDNGTHGNGGGGGGGGGGQGCFWCNNGTGNGGGGGGGGGCYGSGGTGGKAGGSSFGLFLWQSTGINLSNNTIESGDGGNGGAGGNGGDGSAGGTRGLGAVHKTGDIGAGGNGGFGGRGGHGGSGGGGGGGLSYAVYRVSTTLGLPGNNTLSFGDAGDGGGPFSTRGQDGTSGTYNN